MRENFISYFVKVTLFLIVLIFVVAQLLPQKPRKIYNDNELREMVLARGLASTPKNAKELLKLNENDKNKITKAKVELGRELYFDNILSKSQDTSCSTCHLISKDTKNKTLILDMLTSKTNNKTDCVVCHLSDQSAVDRFESSLGTDATPHPFRLNTQSTLNVSLAKYLTWDGSVKNVEEQVERSIKATHKLNLSDEELSKRLSADAKYKKLFAQSFDDINIKNTSLAIGAYLKTLITRGSFDRFLDGDNYSMTQEAKNGLSNFVRFGCNGCHAGVTVGGQSIQKFPIRSYNSIMDVTNTFKSEGREVGSFGFNDGVAHFFPFENKGGFMGKDGKQLFRVPILRNVTKTSPYFHNGSVASLRDAVFLMARHQVGMSLTNQQTDEIIAFLKSLEGDIVEFDIKDGDK